MKWNEVKVKCKEEMKWNEKEEGGWVLHEPRGYRYPHYEPFQNNSLQWRRARAEQIQCERERRGVKDYENGKKMLDVKDY